MLLPKNLKLGVKSLTLYLSFMLTVCPKLIEDVEDGMLLAVTTLGIVWFTCCGSSEDEEREEPEDEL